MNIEGLKNHIRFENIFAEARVDGKISWIKISSMENLPESFIDKYFYKLKPFGIEKNQILTPRIINKYRNELNWYSLLKYQKIPKDCILQNRDIIEKMKLWPLVKKTQESFSSSCTL